MIKLMFLSMVFYFGRFYKPYGLVPIPVKRLHDMTGLIPSARVPTRGK